MMHIDQVVLALLLLGLIGSGVDHWRRGQRRWRLAGLAFVSFYGVGLAAMLSAHCVDILYNLILANRSIVDGSAFTYNWRTYSLLLFGVLIIERGVRVLLATRRFAAGDSRARAEILRNAGVVLAITLPTIPIHAFFGGLISAWSSLALLVTAVGLRGPGRVAPPAIMGDVAGPALSAVEGPFSSVRSSSKRLHAPSTAQHL